LYRRVPSMQLSIQFFRHCRIYHLATKRKTSHQAVQARGLDDGCT